MSEEKLLTGLEAYEFMGAGGQVTPINKREIKYKMDSNGRLLVTKHYTEAWAVSDVLLNTFMLGTFEKFTEVAKFQIGDIIERQLGETIGVRYIVAVAWDKDTHRYHYALSYSFPPKSKSTQAAFEEELTLIKRTARTLV